MSTVHLEYVNDVHLRVNCEASILMEMSEHFTHFAPNYKFNPKFRARQWDGRISLVNRITRLMHAGLTSQIKKFCDARGYKLTWDDEFYYDDVSVDEVKEHFKALNLPENITERDYQIESVVKCLRSKRRTLVSPTSSGKSLSIYAIYAWYKQKTLIIVPRTGLVTQFRDDIISYGFTGKIHVSTDGLLRDNDIDCDICITTWQSLNNGKTKVPKAWYNQFKVVFGDECHGVKATSLINIFSSMENTPYRFGTTGTLDLEPLNKLNIEGLLGPIHKSITTRELIDQGYAPDIEIKCIVLRYPEAVRKQFHKDMAEYRRKNPLSKSSYAEEVNFITNYERRTKFIKNLSLSLKGNKLIFFRKIDHGRLIFDAFEGRDNTFFIDGSVVLDTRDYIRKILETLDDANLVSSFGTTSTGISIKRLHHMIIGAPVQSTITLLQSIGRMLRQHETKESITVYDIVDDLSYKSKSNYALKHFVKRSKIYDSEKFNFKIYNVGIK